MSELSYFSTLDDVIATSNDDLRLQIGYLSPDTVTEYIFHLRDEVKKRDQEISTLRRELELPSSDIPVENAQLKKQITEQNVGNTRPSAPPNYESLPGSSGTATLDFPSSSTALLAADTFPAFLDSIWDWAHNGSVKNGTVKFLSSGEVIWNNGEKQGHWKLREDNRLLETKFNNVYHELRYDEREKTAILQIPVRNPPSVMWKQLVPAGDVFKRESTSTIFLLDAHGRYLSAHPNGKVSCDQINAPSNNERFTVKKVNSKVIALRSIHGKYLSAKPDGKLQWDRAVSNISEYFTVEKISSTQIALISCEGKYVSSKGDGELVHGVNLIHRKASKYFTVMH